MIAEKDFFKLILFVFLFFVLNSIIFTRPGYKTLAIIIVYCLVVFYLVALRGKIDLINPILLLLIPFCYSLFVYQINGNIDHYFSWIILQSFIKSIGLFLLIKISKYNSFKLLLILSLGLNINVMVTFIQYTDLFDLREIAISINSTVSNFERADRFRAMGLVDGYELNGILTSLSFLINYIIFSNLKKSFFKFFSLMFILLSILSVFFTSRTGVVVLVLILLMMFIRKRKNIFSLKQVVKSVGFVCFILIFIFLFILVFQKTYPILFEETEKFILEAYYKYKLYGEFETRSTNALLSKHYHLPNDYKTLLFGNSLRNGAIYDIYSDVGYIQLIYGLGFFGLFLIIILYIVWLRKIIKYKANNYSKFFLDLKFLFIVMIVLMFITNFKGSYFIENPFFFLLIAIMSIILNSSDKIKSQ